MHNQQIQNVTFETKGKVTRAEEEVLSREDSIFHQEHPRCQCHKQGIEVNNFAGT